MCANESAVRQDLRDNAGPVGSPRKLYELTDRLTNLGIIEIKTRGSARRGLPGPDYGITQWGLILYLQIVGRIGRQKLKTQVEFSNLANSFRPFFPRVFAFWPRFQTYKVSDIAAYILIHSASGARHGSLPSNFLKQFEKQGQYPDGKYYAVLANLFEDFFSICRALSIRCSEAGTE
jgi:hypothetical protein